MFFISLCSNQTYMEEHRDIIFFSLSSSSEGNSFYLGTARGGILIDAGIGIRKLIATLNHYNIDLAAIKALFVTHDHSDHTRSVCSLGERYNIPIYATAATVAGINSAQTTKRRLDKSVNIIAKEQPIAVGDFVITPFELPHDASDCVGYSCEAFGRRISIMTDLGHITPTVCRYIGLSDYLVIESNYDSAMLASNPNYPYILKQRIAGSYGHLCNEQTAAALAEHCHDRLKHIWLCHISKDNNTPQIACDVVCSALMGREVVVESLERTLPSSLFLL